MSDKLQQAITAIKSGQKQVGQQLLARVIQEEPNNEVAWLWMSAVVDEDKRGYCIERALKINPNNLQAQAALQKLRATDRKPEAREPVSPPSSANPTNAVKTETTSSPASQEGGMVNEISVSIEKFPLNIGLWTGGIGGVIALVFVYLFYFLVNLFPEPGIFFAIMGLLVLISIGAFAGVPTVRKDIKSKTSIVLGGAVSGFVAASICGLGISLLNIGMRTFPETLLVMLMCGVFAPLPFALVGAIMVWIPRLLILPLRKTFEKIPVTPVEIPAKIREKSVWETPPQASIQPVVAPMPKGTGAIQQPREDKQPDPPVAVEPVVPTANVEEPAFKSTPILQFQKFWVSPARRDIQILFLFEDRLFTGKYESKQSPLVAAQVAMGKVPYDLLTEKITISFSHLLKIEGKVNSLRIDFENKIGRKESIEFDAKDEKIMAEIFNAVEAETGQAFERVTSPMSKGSILLGNGIVLTIILGLSTFFYFAALDFQTNGVSPTGSARTRGLITLINLLGPGGIACIGGGLFLLFLFSMVSSLLKPPLVTRLTRKPTQPNSSPLKNEQVEKITLQTKEAQSPVDTHDSTQSSDNKSLSLLGTALSDGLLAGLAGGILSIIMPIVLMFAQSDPILFLSLIVNGIILLAVGPATGILYFGRKLPRGTMSVHIGGGLAGFLTGGIGGLIFGFVFTQSAIENQISGINQNNALALMLSIFFCGPALVSAILGALTAGIPGSFIKPAPSVKDYDWRDGKSEVEIARIENFQKKQKSKLTTRLIVSGIAITILLIVTVCQSLVS